MYFYFFGINLSFKRFLFSGVYLRAIRSTINTCISQINCWGKYVHLPSNCHLNLFIRPIPRGMQRRQSSSKSSSSSANEDGGDGDDGDSDNGGGDGGDNGGGSQIVVKTGYFVDSAVAGVDFVSGGQTGTTDSGTFTKEEDTGPLSRWSQSWNYQA